MKGIETKQQQKKKKQPKTTLQKNLTCKLSKQQNIQGIMSFAFDCGCQL